MSWVYVILFAASQAIGCLGNAFWGWWRALFFIKWLWTLAQQILTLDLPFTLPHNLIQTTKWISSLSNTCRAVFPLVHSYVSLSSQYILMKEFLPSLNLLCSDPSLNIKLQHCVVMLRGEKRPASQKKTSESGT